MNHGYTYESALAASEQVNWKVGDVIGGEKRLDFSKPFVPESLARVEPLSFLTPREKLVLNQIRGNEYLYVLGLVEEFIVPFVLDQVRPQLHGDAPRVRALLNFASQEAKHIQLFRRFREEFEAGFGSPCEVIGPPSEMARTVLSNHPLAVALMILHIEWMTQRHYIDSVKDDKEMDTQFRSLLKHHWLEEAQHVKLDTLMIEALRESCSEKEIQGAIGEYQQICGMLDGAFQDQVELNLKSLTRATGRRLDAAELEKYLEVQQQALRWTYLGSGMTHRDFLMTAGDLLPDARRQIERFFHVLSNEISHAPNR